MWLAIPAERAAEKRREIEERLTKAYTGQGDAMLEEVIELLGGQTWPSE